MCGRVSAMPEALSQRHGGQIYRPGAPCRTRSASDCVISEMLRNVPPRPSPMNPQPTALTAQKMSSLGAPQWLFNFRLLEQDVFAGHRVELLQFKLGGLGPRVFLCYIVKARIGAAHELDQDGAGLGHGETLGSGIVRSGR